MSTINYVVGSKVITHFLTPEGRTACGDIPEGNRWTVDVPTKTAKLCKKCSAHLQSGIAYLLRHCPKCLRDYVMKVILNPDRSCSTCKSRWN